MSAGAGQRAAAALSRRPRRGSVPIAAGEDTLQIRITAGFDVAR